jgi:hypothetical protein
MDVMGVSRGTTDGLWVRSCFSGVQVPRKRQSDILELERSGHSESIPTSSPRRGNASCSDDCPDTPATTISNYSLSVPKSSARHLFIGERAGIDYRFSLGFFWKMEMTRTMLFLLCPRGQDKNGSEGCSVFGASAVGNKKAAWGRPGGWDGIGSHVESYRGNPEMKMYFHFSTASFSRPAFSSLRASMALPPSNTVQSSTFLCSSRESTLSTLD